MLLGTPTECIQHSQTHEYQSNASALGTSRELPCLRILKSCEVRSFHKVIQR